MACNNGNTSKFLKSFLYSITAFQGVFIFSFNVRWNFLWSVAFSCLLIVLIGRLSIFGSLDCFCKRKMKNSCLSLLFFFFFLKKRKYCWHKILHLSPSSLLPLLRSLTCNPLHVTLMDPVVCCWHSFTPCWWLMGHF